MPLTHSLSQALSSARRCEGSSHRRQGFERSGFARSAPRRRRTDCRVLEGVRGQDEITLIPPSSPPTRSTTPELASGELLDDYCHGYETLKEQDYFLTPAMIEGELPQEIRGTLLQNGPGRFEIDGRKVTHPYDGDGMICSLSIRDEFAFFRSRFVKTPDYARAVRSAHDVRGPGGAWLFNPLEMSSKNPANQGVLHIGRQLFALHEAGLPFHLDSHTLETTGPSTLGGVLQEVASLSARYRIVTGNDGFQKCIAFDASQVGANAAVTIFELGMDGSLLSKKFLTIGGGALGFIQDIAVTQNYYILVENPCSVDLDKMSEHMLGQRSAAECMYLDTGRSTRIHVIPRDPYQEGADGAQTFECGPWMSLQHVNAFELNEGASIVLDTLAWQRFSFTANVFNETPSDVAASPSQNLSRVEIDLRSGNVYFRQMSHRACSYQTTNPAYQARPHKFSYLAAAAVEGPQGPPQVLMKVKVDPMLGHVSSVGSVLWQPGPHCFLGQPHFVPRSTLKADPEDDGWLMVTVYDAKQHRSSVAVLDAANIADGPVASIHLPHHLPHGLGGLFIQGRYLGPARTAPKGWKPVIA